MRRSSLVILFGCAVVAAYLFIASIRFLPLSHSRGFITSPVMSIQRLYFPELRGTCFNPSIVTLDDGYLLSFRWDEPDRCLKNLTKSARWSAKTVRVCLVELDKNFIPKASPQVLSLVNGEGKPLVDPTDMRIVKINGEVVGVFNTATVLPRARTMVRLHMVSLQKDPLSGKYVPSACQQLNYEASVDIEKNWAPFVWKDELYLVYDIAPHTIIKPDPETGSCALVEKGAFGHDWKFGILRGGTPAIPCGNVYISFFHSVLPAVRMSQHQSYYYLMGCYAFNQAPPFHVKALTPVPILPGELYSLRYNRRKILYPSGLTESADRLIVACGENDEHIVIVSIDKKKLFQELKETHL